MGSLITERSENPTHQFSSRPFLHPHATDYQTWQQLSIKIINEVHVPTGSLCNSGRWQAGSYHAPFQLLLLSGSSICVLTLITIVIEDSLHVCSNYHLNEPPFVGHWLQKWLQYCTLICDLSAFTVWCWASSTLSQSLFNQNDSVMLIVLQCHVLVTQVLSVFVWLLMTPPMSKLDFENPHEGHVNHL